MGGKYNHSSDPETTGRHRSLPGTNEHHLCASLDANLRRMTMRSMNSSIHGLQLQNDALEAQHK